MDGSFRRLLLRSRHKSRLGGWPIG
jgi:hypothetical protein